MIHSVLSRDAGGDIRLSRFPNSLQEGSLTTGSIEALMVRRNAWDFEDFGFLISLRCQNLVRTAFSNLRAIWWPADSSLRPKGVSSTQASEW